MNHELKLQSIIAQNVPQFIAYIKNRGGVSDEEFCWLQCREDNPDYPDGLLMRADEYLLYPKNDKIFKKGLFVLTLTLAIMSFSPGGVRFMGLWFCSEKERFWEYD